MIPTPDVVSVRGDWASGERAHSGGRNRMGGKLSEGWLGTLPLIQPAYLRLGFSPGSETRRATEPHPRHGPGRTTSITSRMSPHDRESGLRVASKRRGLGLAVSHPASEMRVWLGCLSRFSV